MTRARKIRLAAAGLERLLAVGIAWGGWHLLAWLVHRGRLWP